jgi:TetR/AcrR family transcriptional repressor of nem operon
MPRPRAFDEDLATDAAMQHFWRHGYAATTVRDLGEAMGLGQASFYNAFGDKRALFTRCLDRYLDGGMREKIARLEGGLPPRAAIEGLLREIVAHSLRDRRGCLLVNTAIEVAPHDTGIARLVAERLAELEAFFRRCVRAGQKAGTINPGRKPADLARLLVSVVMGLRVLARARPVKVVLDGAAREAIALLDPPRSGPSPIG